MATTLPVGQIRRDVVVNRTTGQRESIYFQPFLTYEKSLGEPRPGVGPVPPRIIDNSARIILKFETPNGLLTGATLGPNGWVLAKDASGNPILGEGSQKALLETGPNSLTNQIKTSSANTLVRENLSRVEADRVLQKSLKLSPTFAGTTDPLEGAGVATEEEAAVEEAANNRRAEANREAESPPPPASEPEVTPLSKEGKAEIEKEIAGVKSRKSYDDVIYPENLNVGYQDCIKFTIVEYKPSGLTGFDQSEAGSRFVTVDPETGKVGLGKGKNRKPLATIVLPIPGGIQDSNTVNWSSGTLDPISQAFGNIAQTAITGGNTGAAAQNQAEKASQDPGVRKGIVSWATQTAISGNNIMQRQFGTIINPNVELLFNAPELRTFSFSFKLSPRSAKEAQKVKTIIRNFKQAMSVKRSSSSFLLQSPHTFAISYIFKNKRHPYLNRFKECALISCNVNYTPEGNYMAFDDSEHPSMVSYQLDLTFQELEPLYDDEYNDGYNNIGF